jgi:hypothetical protein
MVDPVAECPDDTDAPFLGVSNGNRRTVAMEPRSRPNREAGARRSAITLSTRDVTNPTSALYDA